MIRSAAIMFATLIAAVPAAAGDAQERRVTVSARGGQVTTTAFATSNEILAVGAALGISYDPTNWLEIGLEGGYLGRPDLLFMDARADGAGGDGFQLFAHLHVIEATATLRLIGGPGLSPAFTRFHPVLELRGGTALRRLTSPELFAPDGSFVAAPADATSLQPFFGVSGGLVYRAGDHLQLGVLASSQLAADHEVVGVQLELSWFFYQL